MQVNNKDLLLSRGERDSCVFRSDLIKPYSHSMIRSVAVCAEKEGTHKKGLSFFSVCKCKSWDPICSVCREDLKPEHSQLVPLALWS